MIKIELEKNIRTYISMSGSALVWEWHLETWTNEVVITQFVPVDKMNLKQAIINHIYKVSSCYSYLEQPILILLEDYWRIRRKFLGSVKYDPYFYEYIKKFCPNDTTDIKEIQYTYGYNPNK